MKQKLRLVNYYALTKYKPKYLKIRYISLLAVLTIMCLYARAQRPEPSGPALSGIVTDTTGTAIRGATITIRGTNTRAITSRDGRFSIQAPKASGTLTVSYLGHQTLEERFDSAGGEFHFVLMPAENMLEEVEVSTGYQTIPKERATGSFEMVDQKLLRRNISTNILDRLDGLVAGATFDLTKTNLFTDREYFRPAVTHFLQIRGQNTFTGEIRPLIVLDNAIYDGDVRNINPNDVEDIYILKDAAAASIWGAQAGNGVVVITTKNPSSQQRTRIELTGNFTFSEKADLYALPQMSSSDFIDYETQLYRLGFYNSLLADTRNFPTLSPVVELLDRAAKGEISAAEAGRQINSFRGIDVRDDYLKYIYRPQTRQQYALNISGGNGQTGYILSGGYDKNHNQHVTSDQDRITLRTAVHTSPLRNLQLKTTMNYARSLANSDGTQSPVAYGTLYSGGGRSFWPYLRLADDEGRPLAVDAVPYGRNFRDTVGNGHLLDWQYRPLAELDASNQRIAVQDILLNIQADYRFLPGWSANALVVYQQTGSRIEDWTGLESYAMRERINLYSQWNDDGVTETPVPVGDQLTRRAEDVRSSTIRLQVNYAKDWSHHTLNALAGVERRQLKTVRHAQSMYGYNRENLSYQPVDFSRNYPLLNRPSGGQRIPDAADFFMDDLINRYVSVYGNAAYSFRKRYTFSASMRRDASNLFGQRSNQRWTPLWSAGVAWHLSEEPFYGFAFLPYAKLRATYGYSGQAITNQAAITVMNRAGTSSLSGLPYATISSPPNSDLRWQRTATLNLALEIATAGKRISGSVEWYRKRSTDLIARGPVDPTTGYASLTTNSAAIDGRGVDITINTVNVRSARFQWQSAWLSNYNRSIVETYDNPLPYAQDYVIASNSSNPREGHEYYGIYALPFAGLNPQTGAPRGYLDGEVSESYTDLVFADTDNLIYYGSSIPVHTATLRNTFTYAGWSLSVNIQAKLGYHFFRDGFSDYNTAMNWAGHSDYALRWQQPGDEQFTHVPSLSYPLDYYRNLFYLKSSALVEKGDHIRLQDANLSYEFPKLAGFSHVRLSLYCNNLNILLWRANKLGIDPLYGTAMPYARTYSFGIQAAL